MCTLYSFFSSRPSEVRLILKSPKCCTIQHKFVPARSVERNIEKIRFPWASNSKFVIFSQIFPRSNYKICPIIPRLFPVSNGDSPVSTTFPRSNYRGFFTTGESYCTMYTLCTAGRYTTWSRTASTPTSSGSRSWSWWWRSSTTSPNSATMPLVSAFLWREINKKVLL